MKYKPNRILRFAAPPVLCAACLTAADPNPTARQIVYHEVDTPAIYTQLGYVTAVILPKNEIILADPDHPIHCGNKGFFETSAAGNVLYIKPMDFPKLADPNTGGKSTNIDIELASGNHMEFEVREVSKTPGIRADLKVFVEEGDESQLIVSKNAPKFVPASELDQANAELAKKNAALEAMQKQAQDKLQAAQLKEVQSIKHGYELFDRKGKEDFHPVVYRDNQFTYIEVHSDEAPTIWEIKDGKPAKVDAPLQDGKYTIQHLVDAGELRVGKSSIRFKFVKE